MTESESPRFHTHEMPLVIMLSGMQKSISQLEQLDKDQEYLAGWTIFEALNWSSSIDWKLKDLTQEFDVNRYGSLSTSQKERIEGVRFIRRCSHHDYAMVLETTSGREEPGRTSINTQQIPEAEWRFVQSPQCDQKKINGRDEYMKHCAGKPARLVLDYLLNSFIKLRGDLTDHDPEIGNR